MLCFSWAITCMIVGMWGLVYHDGPEVLGDVLVMVTGGIIMVFVSHRFDKFVKEFKRANGMKDK